MEYVLWLFFTGAGGGVGVGVTVVVPGLEVVVGEVVGDDVVTGVDVGVLL
jgi:hypothetical protein